MVDKLGRQTELSQADLGKALQMLAWLDEERMRDKAELQKTQQSVEQANLRYRETYSRLEMVEAELRLARAQVSRASQTEDAIRLLREALNQIQEWRDAHDRDWTRTTQSQMAESERDRRAVADFQTRLADLARENEVLKAKLVALGDEMRRDRVSALPAQKEIESLSKRMQAVAERIELLEDGHRHRELRVVELGQHLERLSGEQSRFTDWQRLAEIRWNRQLGDWQAQIEEWRRQMDEGGQVTAGIAKQLVGFKDEVAELREGLIEERDRISVLGEALGKLKSQREVDRDVVAQIEQTLPNLSARVDDAVAHSRQQADRLDRALDQQLNLGAKIRQERERLESVLQAMKHLEERDNALSSSLEEYSRDVVRWRQELLARADQNEQNLADITRRLDLRLQDLERLEKEHKQREIAELEQQLREIQERSKHIKP